MLKIQDGLRRRHLLKSGSKAPLVSSGLPGGKLRLMGSRTKDSPYEADDQATCEVAYQAVGEVFGDEDMPEGFQRRIDDLHARTRAPLQC